MPDGKSGNIRSHSAVACSSASFTEGLAHRDGFKALQACSSSSYMLVVDSDYHHAWLFAADAEASKPVLLSDKFYPWDHVYLEKIGKCAS